MVKASKSTEKPTTTPSKKASKPVKAEAAPAPTPVVAEPTNTLTPAAPEGAADTSSLVFKMSEFTAKLNQLISLFSTVKSDFKTLEKAVSREMKAAAKASSKKRRNNVNRKPSGFVKPALISEELAAFLGKAVGSEMARTEVSKEINAYIQTHQLQDKQNGRIIHPDAKLTKLLKVDKNDELTYFNLQRYMKHHFTKSQTA
jgi:chromatin remodeling complex protein RSC6